MSSPTTSPTREHDGPHDLWVPDGEQSDESVRAADERAATANPVKTYMQLKVLLPTEVLVDVRASRVVAEASDGSFCLRPKHTDFVAALIPGILTFVSDDEVEHFVGVADGVLVKSESDVRVSVRNAVVGTDLETLRTTVAERFLMLDDRERVARSAIAKLEADFVRRFLKFGELHA